MAHLLVRTPIRNARADFAERAAAFEFRTPQWRDISRDWVRLQVPGKSRKLAILLKLERKFEGMLIARNVHSRGKDWDYSTILTMIVDAAPWPGISWAEAESMLGRHWDAFYAQGESE